MTILRAFGDPIRRASLLVRSRTAVSASALLVVASMVLPSAALANPFPNNADTRVADSALHTYCWTASMNLQEEQDVAQYAMDVLVETTDMTINFVQNCGAQTDVWWYSVDLDPGLRGLRLCQLWPSGAVCDSSDVYFDLVELDVGPNDWQDRRKTSVHELGHSIGLGHNNVDANAMIQGEIPSDSISYRRYTNHDVNHINTAY